MQAIPSRPRSTLLAIVLLWLGFYASFTLFTPPLLDDADSVHAEVAREMLLRHDYVTLYANGIRYLEKAPLLYWSMAASMKLSQICGATSPQALAVAARIPLSLTMLGLALLVEAFARRLYRSTRAGLYAALITLSSFGLFIFTRITIPDAMVCLFTTLALYAFYRAEELTSVEDRSLRTHHDRVPRVRIFGPGMDHLRFWCSTLAAACALNVLTKGLIGLVFPSAIILLYLLLKRGLRGTRQRLSQLHLVSSTLTFLAIAAPWHIAAGLANATQGHPTPFHFVHGHWIVPLPTDGNVRGWFWFYFMNEHLLRYLNLRVPHDYDTSPLWLFWGLCFIWLMPWSAFVFKAMGRDIKRLMEDWRRTARLPYDQRPFFPFGDEKLLFLEVWAAFILLFFSLSTRQEYYVLPALPAVAIAIAGWLAPETRIASSSRLPQVKKVRVAIARCLYVLLALGTIFAVATGSFLLHTKSPAPDTGLATLLQQNPGDYALSMGHFLDLNAQALGLFRLPLAIAALSLFFGPLTALILRKGSGSLGAKPHAANLALAAGAFGFLLAAHLGLRTFSPVLTSAQLAEAIAQQVQPQDLIVIHGEYEAGSTLAFYLQRPASYAPQPNTAQFIHILEGRSSNLWYGSFFPDAPKIFESPQSLAAKWQSPQRIFLWQSLTDPPSQLPPLPGPVYILVKSGGKEILSNQPNR